MNRARALWRTDRGRVAHYVAAGAAGIFILVDASLVDLDARKWFILLAAGAAVALLGTRDLPFAAPLLAALAITGMVLVDAASAESLASPFVIAVLFIPWCIGSYNDRSRAIVGLVVMEALLAWVNSRFGNHAGDYFWIGLFAAIAWSAGFVLNRRSAHARSLAERAARLEVERIESAQLAVAEERQRIARELHDVIAHSVSVMTVQAGAVRRLLLPEQEKERQALETVEATGRQALTEMRRLVGLLKEQSVMPEYAPQPGMEGLGELLERVRESGLPVDLVVRGTPFRLAPGVDLAAYRVVQEALTNALKYAGPARAWVTVDWGESQLELEIANDGRGNGSGHDGGHGLTGMRERVSLYGGELESGGREGGGFVVRARLPIEERI
jgi:signal transduction histidine kinase